MSDYTALVRTKLAPNALQLATTTSGSTATTTATATAATGHFSRSQFGNSGNGASTGSNSDVRALLRGYARGSRILCSKDSFVQGAKGLLTGLVPQEILTVVRVHQVDNATKAR